MSIVLEDSNLNVAEQVNVLFKSSLGFPSTKESTPWFQETSVKYNNYVNGEEILLDEIPSNPSFSVTPNLVDVNVSSSQLATGGYIKEDSTGVIRQYHRLILTPVPNSSNNSYYALDTEGNNILTDGLQFNTKWSGSGNKIYPYTLYTEAFISADSSAPNELGQDSTGGNWLYDLKNGVIFFPDYSSSLCNGTTNKPVFSFYKYIGRKGMVKQIDFKNSLLDIPNTTKKYDKQIVVQTSDNTIHRYDSATSSWVSIGGSGGGETYDLTVSNDLTVSGKVGIGTTSPGAKLEVNGNVEIRRTAGETSSLTVSSVGTALNNMKNSIIYMGTRYSTSETGYEGKKIALIAESLNNNEWADVNKAKLHFCVNNDSSNGGTSADLDDSRMTIQPNGNVGIGTASPRKTFDVVGDAIVSGNVGIGTTSPLCKLDINYPEAWTQDATSTTRSELAPSDFISSFRPSGNSADAFISIRASGESNKAGIYFGTPANTYTPNKCAIIAEGGQGYSRSKLHFCFATNGSNSYGQASINKTEGKAQMTIQHDGNVGIGTTSPGAKLEVNGNVEIRRTAGETSSLTVSSVGTALNNMKNSIIYMGTRYSTSETGYEGKKIALIAESLNNNEWADVNKAKLHFCVNNDSSNGGTSADLDDSRMTIQPNGKVGIGSTSPGAALDIAAGTSGQGGFTDNAQYLRLADIHGTNWDPGGSGGWGGGPTRDSYGGWSLHCHHEAAFAAHIFVYSDRRIKTNIVDVSDNQALEMVRNIPCRYYEYKDKLTRGYDKTIGFIAQEVREVMPMAVKTLTTIIPNEMRNLTDISWNNTTLYSDLSDCSGVKYRFYVSNDISGNETMKEVVGNNDDSFTFDTSYNYVYCYGKEVDDFHTLDKAKLFALNFSATQEIDRIQQQQLLDISGNKIDIELLKLENEELKLENSTLTTKVNILETELNNLKSVVQGLIEAQMSS